jgi:hypothetical protein
MTSSTASPGIPYPSLPLGCCSAGMFAAVISAIDSMNAPDTDGAVSQMAYVSA